MAEYHLLQEIEEAATPLNIRTGVVQSEVWKLIAAFACFLAFGTFTVALRITVPILFSTEAAFTDGLSFLDPPGLISKNFTHDKNFRLGPSPESDEAWRSILPNGLGIVQHPAFGPELVSLAFVHQLHCLDTIRKNYFAARNGNSKSETDKHTVHCLDYIRQALQCHADTNLEFRVVSGRGDVGFTGYGEHQCRDFDRVFRFAEEWRVYEGKNDSERVRISEEETIRERVIDYDYVSSRGDPDPTDRLES